MKRAALRCDAELIAPAAATSDAQASDGKFRAGRWRLNAGSRMLMCIQGLNDDDQGVAQPAIIILDMASVQTPDKMPAIVYHEDDSLETVIGTWENIKVDGGALNADLVLVDVENDREAAALPDAVRAKALIRAGVPLQVSIGAGADYDQLNAGDDINGTPFEADADDDTPAYAARMAVLSEGSLLLRGADSRTGQIAAKAAPIRIHKDSPMIDLKKLKAKYADKSPEIRAAALDLATNDGATEQSVADEVHKLELKAANDAAATAKKELDELKAKAAKSAQTEVDDKDLAAANKLPGHALGGGAGGADGSGPTDWAEARRLVASELPKLKGLALNAEVNRRFPKLDASDVIPPGTMLAAEAAKSFGRRR